MTLNIIYSHGMNFSKNKSNSFDPLWRICRSVSQRVTLGSSKDSPAVSMRICNPIRLVTTCFWSLRGDERITKAYIRCGQIANPTERKVLMKDGSKWKRGRLKMGGRTVQSGWEAEPSSLAAAGDDIDSGRCQYRQRSGKSLAAAAA